MAQSSAYDWKAERKTGVAVIALSLAINLVLWFELRRLIPPLAGMESLRGSHAGRAEMRRCRHFVLLCDRH